jgi:hypothetical protein
MKKTLKILSVTLLFIALVPMIVLAAWSIARNNIRFDTDFDGNTDFALVYDGTYSALLFGTELVPSNSTARGIRYSTGDIEYNDGGGWTDFGVAEGGAPGTAPYITQTPDDGLSNEQAISSLTDGLLKHVSGVLARAIPGTDYQAALTYPVTGAVSTTENNIPQWDADDDDLKDGLTLVTTVGDPGSDDDVPTDQAVREAIDAIPPYAGLGETPTGNALPYVIKNEDWADITDWDATAHLGTYTIEESPSGQLHLAVGDSSGTDSYGVVFIDSVSTSLNLCTLELKIKFDVLGSAFDGVTAQLNDDVTLAIYNGLYARLISFSSDSVWVYQEANTWAKAFDATFDNTSWYTIRIVFGVNYGSMWISDDGAGWAYAGSFNNMDANTATNGRVQFAVYNYPASPATTEIHVEYFQIAPGWLMP